MAGIQNTLLYRDIERRRAELDQSRRESEHVARQYASMAERSSKEASERRAQEKHEAEKFAMLHQGLGGEYSPSDYGSSAGRGGAALGYMSGRLQDKKAHESRAFDAAKIRSSHEHDKRLRDLADQAMMDRHGMTEARLRQQHSDMLALERDKMRRARELQSSESIADRRKKTEEFIKLNQADLRTLSSRYTKLVELSGRDDEETRAIADRINQIEGVLDKAKQFYVDESGRPNYYTLSKEEMEMLRLKDLAEKQLRAAEQRKLTPKDRVLGAAPPGMMVDEMDESQGIIHRPGVNDRIAEKARAAGLPVLTEEEARIKNPSFWDMAAASYLPSQNLDLWSGVKERGARREDQRARMERERNAEIEEKFLRDIMSPDDEAAAAAEAMGYAMSSHEDEDVLSRLLKTNGPLSSIEDPEVLRALIAARGGQG